MDLKEKERAGMIAEILQSEYPDSTTALVFKNPFELLVSTILSAQCTDKQVNKITPSLFERYKSPRDFADADLTELENMVRSTGFYKNKAKNIKAASQMIAGEFSSSTPDNMDDLLKLPGVARKTANIVLIYGFDKVEGIAVDTHVLRLSRRLGFSKSKNPKKVEQDLMELFPENLWKRINSILISHGRAVCTARSPSCCDCVIRDYCLSSGCE